MIMPCGQMRLIINSYWPSKILFTLANNCYHANEWYLYIIKQINEMKRGHNVQVVWFQHGIKSIYSLIGIKPMKTHTGGLRLSTHSPI